MKKALWGNVYGLDGLVCGVDFKKNILQDFVNGYGFTKNGITDEMTFDGVDDYLMCKYPLKNLSDITMVLKIKVYGEKSQCGYFGTQENRNVGENVGSHIPNLYINGNDMKMGLWNGDNDNIYSVGKNTVLDGKNHIFVYSGNSSTAKFYIDGNLIVQQGRINQTWCDQFTLGVCYDSGSRVGRSGWTYGKCDVAYFLVYNRVLSDVEIGELK